MYDTTNFQYNYDHPDWHPYYNGTDLHTLQSCTKSITSLLTGIAVDEALILNSDIKVMELFESYNPDQEDFLKDSISLQDLLTMRGGFKWDEWSTHYTDPKNNCYILENSENWLDYILGLPMDTIPGTKFVYNGGITVLLGEIIRIKTGMRIDKWAEEKLFKPLDIKDYYWKTSPNGEVDTEGGLYLSIFDFAKIGQLILNKGTWQGKRIISEKWLDESTSHHVKLNGSNEWYGYQWWLSDPQQEDHQLIMALGFGGQYLFIDRENNLLTVMNGWNIHGSPEVNPFSVPFFISETIKK
jgi:CubicO group peptidase (beta-lactamase class C family)